MMTSAEISDLKLARVYELAKIKADLLNVIDCKGENLLRVRKIRANIDDLRDALERDYYRVSKRFKEVEAIVCKERKRLEIERLQARIDELKAEL